MTDAEAVDRLKSIIRLAGELAADSEHPELRNRAIEIAASADIMVWSLAPDESDWLDSVYDGSAEG